MATTYVKMGEKYFLTLGPLPLASLIREGEGRGSEVKILSFILAYVVALHVCFPKWFHLISISKRLLRYELSKLEHFRTFSAILLFWYRFLARFGCFPDFSELDTSIHEFV